MGWNETIWIKAPAAPGDAATVTLFNSTTMFGGEACAALSLFKISRVIVTFLSINQASAANGLVPSASSNDGANWDQTETGITVAASVAGSVETHDFAVDRFRDFKLLFTAGATGPTTWRVTVCAIVGQRVVSD